MKKILVLLITVITFAGCSKDDVKPKTELEKLPAATQTGANTFGCLLDGKAFLRGNTHNSLDCVYQFIDGEYYFGIQANRDIDNDRNILIGISTNAKELLKNTTYTLKDNNLLNVYGTYGINGIMSATDGNNYTGELVITNVDETNHIISGTFWFDVRDFNNVVHQIREGRFDMQYTN